MRLGGATVADEAIVSIVRGAVAGVPGARLDLPGRVSRVLPGRRGPVEWVVKGGTIAFDVDVCAGYGRVLPQLAGSVRDAVAEHVGDDDRPRGAGRRRDRHGDRPQRGRAVTESRRTQRRAAAFLLYQRDLTGAEFEPLYAAYERDNGTPPGDFARAAAEGVWADRERLDGVIDDAALEWTAERMAVLERNILRLAVWELTGRRGACRRRHRRGRHAHKALCVARGRGTGERRPRPGRARAGGGVIDEPRLEQLAADLQALGARMEAGELDADQATALLEQITALVYEAVDVLERAGEGLEAGGSEPAPD